MKLAEYLSIATSLGLSRRDALLMEISTVHGIAKARAESAKKRGDRGWR